MNVLLTSINYDYMDSVFGEILKQLSPATCAVTFPGLESAKRFPQLNALADHAFCYWNCRYGCYQAQPFYDELPPLGPETINQLVPYERDILMMLTRDHPQEHKLVVREYYNHLRYWSYVLEKLSIDIHLTFILPHASYDAIIYALCKTKGIPTVCLSIADLKEYLYPIFEIKDPCPELKKKYKELKEAYSETAVEDIVFSDLRIEAQYMRYIDHAADITPLDMKKFREEQKQNRKRNGKIKLIRNRLKLIRYLISHSMKFDTNTFKHFRKHSYNHREFLEYDILVDYYKQHCSHPVAGEKYIYIPLHMQPEFTTAPLGSMFSDQFLMIDMLARFLPEGYYLYVKEHPAQQQQNEFFPASRHLEFYEDIVNLKNVKLMSVEEDTYSLINNSVAVATVTGTAGFEAIARGKPYLMFGYQITQYASGVLPIRSNEDCKKAIQLLTKGDPSSIACTPKDFKIYLKAIEETCFYGTFWYEPEMHATLSENELAESERNIIKNYVARVRSLSSRPSKSFRAKT